MSATNLVLLSTVLLTNREPAITRHLTNDVGVAESRVAIVRESRVGYLVKGRPVFLFTVNNVETNWIERAAVRLDGLKPTPPVNPEPPKPAAVETLQATPAKTPAK